MRQALSILGRNSNVKKLFIAFVDFVLTKNGKTGKERLTFCYLYSKVRLDDRADSSIVTGSDATFLVLMSSVLP